MESTNLSSTQFADSCRIPRPSLSQLLSGRNKKVSDELITKIHEAFPRLSVSWLLFGEGSMESDANIRFSEPQNNPNLPFDEPQSTINQPNESAQIPNYSATTFSSDNFDRPQAPTSRINLNTPTNKRISNIVVFYDDNSFESFIPSPNN